MALRKSEVVVGSARGIDWMERSGSGGGASFPLYDGHGNMIATLSRSGSGSFAVSNARSYDVWGSVRSGSSAGDPNTRYCANLGHKQDDESGLLYMRARYYEPWTGRFITEDPARDGWNWFVYCYGNPIGFVDDTGETPIQSAIMALYNALGLYFGMQLGYGIAVLVFSRCLGFPYDWKRHTSDSLFAIFAEAVALFVDLSRNSVAQMSRTDMVRMMRRSLAQTGFGRYATSFRLSFTVGLIVGAFAAYMEFKYWELEQM